MNSWNGTGRLGKAPEGVTLPSGSRKATFPISVIGERKKSEGGWEPATLWLTITVFGQAAENAEQVLKSGDLVEIVNGRLTKSTWQTESGENRSSIGIVAGRWQLIPTGNVGDSTQAEEIPEEGLGF